MIRRFITAQRDNTPVVHWGDGTASRDFLFVDDCCEAIKMSIENIDDPTPINVGSGYECTMQELSNRIAGAIDFKGDIVWDKSKPNGQPRRCLDISRATELLGFKPRTSLDIGLDATIKWYLENA
jgi:GDP-L-fucose synthase